MQASMASNDAIALTAAQVTYVEQSFSRKTLKIGEFLGKKVKALPNGEQRDSPLTEAGLALPTNGYVITEETTYR